MVTYVIDLKKLMKKTAKFLRNSDVPLHFSKSKNEMYENIQKANPRWTDEQIRAEAFIYIFPPSWDLQTPPPHSTGAALDLTLADSYGKDLDMESDYGDFETPLVYTNAEGLTDLQRQNRILLITSMANQGFMSYPGEWWHFSLFDREWAAYLGLKVALYTRMNDPYS